MRSDLPQRLTRDDRDVLAVPIGISRNEFAVRKFSALRKHPGWLVGDGEIREWRVEGFFQQEGRLYLYGPYLEGLTLAEVSGKPQAGALPYLSRLASALLTLHRQRLSLEHLQADAVIFAADGRVLFLPAAVMDQVRRLRPEEYRIEVFEQINHPDIEQAEQRLSFSLAALLYRAVRGEYPFSAQSEEEVHNRVRNARLLPLRLGEPGLREEISRQIENGLGRGEEKAPSVQQWSELLHSCQREGLYRQISEDQKQTLRLQAEKEQGRIARAYRRKVFWQRHWKTVLIVAAALIAGGILAGSYLRNVLAPPATRGFSPRQVVEAFYRGLNDLDHALMEDCLTDGAGKEAIREVVNIYVLSRVSMGYEGRSHIMPADQWDQLGRPPLEPGRTLFGVTDLHIVPERAQPQPQFRVDYLKWFPVPAEEQEPSAAPAAGPDAAAESSGSGSALRYTRLKVSERVYLRQVRQDWRIHRFERLSPP